jgi:hypothetical protein
LDHEIALNIAHSLQQEHGEPAVVLLEEIKMRLKFSSHIAENHWQRRLRSDLAAFEPGNRQVTP